MKNLLKNKRGNIFMSIMVAIILFMVGMMVVNFIRDDATTTRISLGCGTPADLTDGGKALCLITKTSVSYFIILALSIAGGVITDKLLV